MAATSEPEMVDFDVTGTISIPADELDDSWGDVQAVQNVLGPTGFIVEEALRG